MCRAELTGTGPRELCGHGVLRVPGQGRGFAGLERPLRGSKVATVVEPWEALCL